MSGLSAHDVQWATSFHTHPSVLEGAPSLEFFEAAIWKCQHDAAGLNRPGPGGLPQLLG